jgi:dipeptidyl aminopeptidase/acylaminoacyl peptidase
MRISPDGTRVAGSRTIDGNSDIWIIDVTQGGAETKFTTDPARDTYPVWSPDSTQIVFLSERTGIENLYLRAADGTGADVHLFETVERAYPGDWSRDGKWLLFSTFSANGFDLWVLPMTGAERKPIRFLRNSSANEASPRFSPDGRFVAYVSDESGTYELYVKPFDPAAPEASVNGGGIKVSRNGIVWSSGIGEGPRWERDAKGVVKGLIYFSSDRKRWLTDITTVPVFRVLDRHLLGEFLPGASWLASTPDNQQVLAAAPTVNQQPSATVVLNWQAGLKK